MASLSSVRLASPRIAISRQIVGAVSGVSMLTLSLRSLSCNSTSHTSVPCNAHLAQLVAKVCANSGKVAWAMAAYGTESWVQLCFLLPAGAGQSLACPLSFALC